MSEAKGGGEGVFLNGKTLPGVDEAGDVLLASKPPCPLGWATVCRVSRLFLLTLFFVARLQELDGSIPKACSRLSFIDALGRAQTETSNGVTHTYKYALERKWTSNGQGGGGLLYAYTFGYDAGGNLELMSEYKAGLALRSVGMSYYVNDRLQTETVYAGATTSAPQTTSTTYSYDVMGDRTQRVVAHGATTNYTYINGRLLSYLDTTGSNVVTFVYDGNGNRTWRHAGTETDTYGYDTENRLISLSQGGTNYGYLYDYRTRRVSRTEAGVSTQVVFSGGNSVQEYVGGTSPNVEFVRGSDWGGGVSGILYSVRGGQTSYDHYDGRGDVATQTNGAGVVTYQADYEAWGTRTAEFGSDADRQRANTKEEDPTGLLDEGMRYRDLAAGVFLTRDPAGFVDGPNLYGYVRQNPWTKFDPEGLNSTWGGDNWFANWVLPDPVAHYHASQAGAANMFDSSQDSLNRTAGVGSYLGNGAMVVLSLIPGEASIEGGVERLAVRGVAQVAEREGVDSVVKTSAQKILQNTTQQVAKDVPKAVGLDTNAIIARLEGSDPKAQQAIIEALKGRIPNVSITAIKEFLRGGGDVGVLRQFLQDSGGKVAKAATSQTVGDLTKKGLKKADAQVVGSAVEEGTKVLTRNKEVLKKAPDVAQPF